MHRRVIKHVLYVLYSADGNTELNRIVQENSMDGQKKVGQGRVFHYTRTRQNRVEVGEVGRVLWVPLIPPMVHLTTPWFCPAVSIRIILAKWSHNGFISTQGEAGG